MIIGVTFTFLAEDYWQMKTAGLDVVVPVVSVFIIRAVQLPGRRVRTALEVLEPEEISEEKADTGA